LNTAGRTVEAFGLPLERLELPWPARQAGGLARRRLHLARLTGGAGCLPLLWLRAPRLAELAARFARLILIPADRTWQAAGLPLCRLVAAGLTRMAARLPGLGLVCTGGAPEAFSLPRIGLVHTRGTRQAWLQAVRAERAGGARLREHLNRNRPQESHGNQEHDQAIRAQRFWHGTNLR
jgi:hypothetical protein